MATMVSGTHAAVVPMEVPAMRRVSGMIATMRMMNGIERMMLTMVLKIWLMNRFSSIWPLPVMTSVTPRGMPMMAAMIVETETMKSVSSMPCIISLMSSGDIS